MSNKDDRRKDSFMEIPIEQHDTAAWANIHKEKPVSKVSVPSKFDVKNAKEYVDSNQK
ncbi:hypothetical protein BJV85_001382 [Clostridium acetobutylicum]|nr:MULTISPECIES: DUF3787 domain-containing protein [Clostridium]ADZ21555.1 Conserved hypothetical protein [Clostridium acetobutylicum EA 2018]AWV79125.1 DUF3787 domain-containing protein [Clostridium acetobutylicum]MBC2394912.1 DUF3787 domain-containing protein [Clostridium acetobutylicum]MBC2586286.1 DUF3787 domain-containing protein [Clostridium acetobutylicum]NOV88416.1 hypothetical protein [Clostridium acetobutylicum]